MKSRVVACEWGSRRMDSELDLELGQVRVETVGARLMI